MFPPNLELVKFKAGAVGIIPKGWVSVLGFPKVIFSVFLLSRGSPARGANLSCPIVYTVCSSLCFCCFCLSSALSFVSVKLSN